MDCGNGVGSGFRYDHDDSPAGCDAGSDGSAGGLASFAECSCSSLVPDEDAQIRPSGHG